MPTSAPSTLTVNTRRGPITFTTTLEWEEAVRELTLLAEGGNDFALSLLMRERENKYLSQTQVSWVYKLAQDALDERNLDGKVTKLEVRSTDASSILGCLAEANAKGIKKPVLRLMLNEDYELRVKFMTTGRNVGGAWVTANGELFGKIDCNGAFTFVGNSYSDETIAETFSFIESVNRDPKASLEAYGKMTSRCGCCGLPLTNAKSIELGIGPICLDKYGLLSIA